MEFDQLFILSVIQGITEFLPISSSGHLALVPMLTNWVDQGMKIDVAVHVGTLFAVMIYFFRDVWGLAMALPRAASGQKNNKSLTLLGLLILSTIPVVIAGFAVKYFDVVDQLRSLTVIAWTTLGFGIVLWLTDRFSLTIRRIDHINWVDALVIGLAQCLAIIPGTSRSGITMSAARFLGMERPEAARFAMLMSIPTIIAAGALITLDIIESGDAALGQDALMAAGLSFVAALVTLVLFMSWIRRASMGIFVVYRLALGCFLLAIVYGFQPALDLLTDLQAQAM